MDFVPDQENSAESPKRRSFNHSASRIKLLAKKLFSPKILVASSLKSQEICKKNNLTPAELLRPFLLTREKNIRIRSIEREITLSPEDISIICVDGEEYR